MCWIVGIFGEIVEKETAIRSLEQVRYRGSSAFELQEFPHAILWANRLPIQGRVSGTQPISNEEGTIWACQNGEIFNYFELRQSLEKLWHMFKTDCDTEVLVHLYEEYGIEAIKKIESEMFALIVYNSLTWDVFVGRDRLGVKPLYYGFHENGNIHFASELKQLVQFEDIVHVLTFPKWHYYINGEFCRYDDCSSLASDNLVSKIGEVEPVDRYSEEICISQLTGALENAVKKRVQTDLPIGVFLSGGVDSSLVMELATRYHPDVTAIILGTPWASDYEFALRLCKEKGYRYHVVVPDAAYRKRVEEMIWYCETYEPLIIRHAFANDMCSRAAAELGIKVVLLWEWSDEIFAGYNEFSYVPLELINTACTHLLHDLEFGHLKRVDRLAMKYTIETRCPFLDAKVVEIWAHIPALYKIKEREQETVTKYILRKVAEQFLPDYIAWRYKVPFANGAGMNVWYNYKKSDGEVSAYVDSLWDVTHLIDDTIRLQYGLYTNTEAHHFGVFERCWYTKLVDCSKRLLVKDTLKELASASTCASLSSQPWIYCHVHNIMRSIKKPIYRRYSPSHENMLCEIIEKLFRQWKPLRFFLFWWAADKPCADEYDNACISYLKMFFEDIAASCLFGVTVTFLLADEHALNNGYTKDMFVSYLQDVSSLVNSNWWHICYLSDMYRLYGIEREHAVQRYIEHQALNRRWELPIKAYLEKNAQKHYRWWLSVWSPAVLWAQLYYAMRMCEKPFLAAYFKENIFLTFWNKKLQSLYPHLPTLYMYSWVWKRTVLPWFARK